MMISGEPIGPCVLLHNRITVYILRFCFSLRIFDFFCINCIINVLFLKITTLSSKISYHVKQNTPQQFVLFYLFSLKTVNRPVESCHKGGFQSDRMLVD